MKPRNILLALLCIALFILLTRIIPLSQITSSTTNYAPDGYTKTIEASINGVVVYVKQQGLYWVTINDRKLPFSYDEHSLPQGWKNTYPNNFIQVGDSISKNANSDTFYLIRTGNRWQYCLPK